MQRSSTFHPLTVSAAALTVAAIFALVLHRLFEGDFRWFLLYYIVPISIPFVCFLFDRAEHAFAAPRMAWTIDLAVLIPALIRMLVPIPMISGHALFLTHALLTCRSVVARFSAAIMLLQVAYLKIFVWHDVTIIGGALLGIAMALLYQRVLQRHIAALQ